MSEGLENYVTSDSFSFHRPLRRSIYRSALYSATHPNSLKYNAY